MVDLSTVPRARRAALIIITVLAVCVLGACAKRTDTATMGVAPSAAGNVATVPTTAAGSFNTDVLAESKSSSQVVTGGTPSTTTLDPNAGRSVVSTANVTVKVDDVGVAKDKAADAVAGDGGYVFGEESTFGEKSSSVLTLKVPPANFRKLLDELGQLGAVSAEQVKTDDVTQQVIDLDARIRANSDSLDRTRDLLTNAKSLPEIQQLENEVVRRQSDLESLRGQQKTLAEQVSLSTIVVTLAGEHDATPAVAQQREAEQQNSTRSLPGFGDGLRGGLGVAGAVGTVLLAALGALLPFLPVLVATGGVVYLVRRRRLRAQLTGTADTDAGAHDEIPGREPATRAPSSDGGPDGRRNGRSRELVGPRG